MLLSLTMRNIALIESLTLDFREGLHVMTGETGAGKSIVVDAVDLVLGGRADRDLIRTGTDRAYVEALFDVRGSDQVAQLLAAQQLEAEGGVVTLSREISRSGRNICRVCGVTMPVTFLRELAALLMDVHGQHEHTFLMDPKRHLAFLDDYGDAAYKALLAQVAADYDAFIQNHRAYARLVKENDRKERRMAELKASLSELERAKLRRGEEEALRSEKEAFRHAEKISAALETVHTLLTGDGASEGIVASVHGAEQALAQVATIAPGYRALHETCQAITYELEELGFEVRHLRDESDFDPARAEKVEARLDLLRRLSRRYGETSEQMLETQREYRAEYDALSGMEEHMSQMAAEHKKLLSRYRQSAKALTEAREALARRFEQAMMAQLRDLGMEKTVFQVAFTQRAEGKQTMPQPLGDDGVEFMLSPNPGEPLKSLSKIASGGELSRLMLAIKSLEAEKGGVGTMVFDEIDTGISGRMAQVVAEKMARIARSRQVLCVTHLPQIAAMADHQLLVEKHEELGRTNTSVRMLDADGREKELARMIGGAGDSLVSAKAHAAEMLKEAARSREEI